MSRCARPFLLALAVCSLLCLPSASASASADADADEAKVSTGDSVPAHVRGFLDSYCLGCHRGKRAKAKLDLSHFETLVSVAASPRIWKKVAARVRDAEMPPEDEKQPAPEARARFLGWIESFLSDAACADGVSPGPALIRRLNRTEYGATIRDLLRVFFNAAETLPADGAGGEGFDNAAETLFLSPVHVEKYLEAARKAIDYAIKDPAASRRLLVARPGGEKAPREAARRVLERFLPLAFRRAAREGELEGFLALFDDASGHGESFEEAISFALRGVLISPHFLLRIEKPVTGPSEQPLDDYELASRLSYFLWGSMPDGELFRIAHEGKLQDDEVLERQVKRMLASRRMSGFATSFVEQWLGTRELGRGIKPDRADTRGYNDDLEAVMKYEPVLFFEEILRKNLSLLTLLDADFSYMNNRLARFYRLKIDRLREHPKRVDLPDGSHRGGVLGMAAVLAVSSYPHRTSPVLRGKWILETLLGTPPPPPPPNVPELEESGKGVDAATVRERLLRHRAKPTCAACHDRIDPLGFGLENYDRVGRWRTTDAGRAIDSRGRLPDGTNFDGPEALKAVLIERKHEFVHHLTSAILGYALCRGLTLDDACVVDSIVDRLEQEGLASHRLIMEVVRSVPFRMKSGATRPTARRDATPNGESEGQER